MDGSFALQIALGESAWQRNDAKAAVGHFERAYGLLDGATASVNGLLVTASALAAILEGWQDFDGTGRWMERLKEHLAARSQIVDTDAGLRIDRAILQSTNMVWGGGFGDVQALVGAHARILATRPRRWT